MGKCIICGRATSNKNYLYCRDCYSEIIDFCELCDAPFFDEEDIYTVLIDECTDYNICEKCFKNFLKINNLTFKSESSNSSDKKVLTKEKYPYSCVSEDGHPARSRGEQIIDNYLFNNNIKHVYEKVLVSPISGAECTCDFYLPDYDVYIEFWGMENSKKYDEIKEYKLKIYRECNCKLFELTKDDVDLRLDYCFQKFMYRYKKIK